MNTPSGIAPRLLAVAGILLLAGCATSRSLPGSAPRAAVSEIRSEAVKHPSAAWLDYLGTSLYRVDDGKAYCYVTKSMTVDADGAPNAYHPDDKGIDALGNAGYPRKKWWKDVLVADAADPSRAFVQPKGEYAGFFVSKTALQDGAKAVTDPARYVDARNIPYLVFPGSFYALKGTGEYGDIGIAINLDTHESSAFIVADQGPSEARLGEVSICLAERLGGKNVNPRTGSGLPKGRVLYVVFPHSKAEPAWPLSDAAIKEKAAGLLESIGGWETVIQAAAH